MGTYLPEEFIFQFHIFLPFHTVHGTLNSRILKLFSVPFSRGHVLSEQSTVIRPSWVALHGMAHSFNGLDKAVVHVIWLVFCGYGFHSVCPLRDKDKRLMESS